MAHHFSLVLPQTYAAILPVYDPSAKQPPVGAWWLVFTPLHLLWGGTEAVVLFFVLSGFVLSIPFYSGHVSYRGFVANRVCRIYPAYLAAVFSGMVMASIFSDRHISGVSEWFNSIWKTPLTVGLLAQHILLVDNFKNGVFDPVVWSLVHEMRVSLIFPLLMVLVVRARWPVSLVAGWGVSLAGAYVPFGPSLLTLEYLPMFVVGALLAKHRGALTRAVSRLPSPWALLLLGVAILSYTYAWWFLPHSTGAHPAVGVTYGRLLNDVVITLGASLFIVLTLGRAEARSILVRAPLVWLGRVSYSVYLFHAVVLFTFVYWLYPRVPLFLVWPIALATTAAVAALSYRYIEKPWIRLGHRLAGWFARSGQEIALERVA